MDNAEMKALFADKAYVESIARMSAEDAAKSLQAKGVEVTADELIRVRDYVEANREKLENGELDDKALAEVAGGAQADIYLMYLICLTVITAPLW